MTLEIGAVSDTITVAAEAPLLDTSSISAGRVMENRSVNDLPTFNNSPLMLIKLAPGIQAGNNRRYNGVNALGGTAEAHSAGNVGGNDWSIDGVPDMGNGYSAAYLPYSTTIQEFKVETANFDAAMGRSRPPFSGDSRRALRSTPATWPCASVTAISITASSMPLQPGASATMACHTASPPPAFMNCRSERESRLRGQAC